MSRTSNQTISLKRGVVTGPTSQKNCLTFGGHHHHHFIVINDLTERKTIHVEKRKKK